MPDLRGIGALLVPHWGGAYWQKPKSTGPIVYWPLWDAVGAAVAEDISGNGFHGAPTAVTFGATGIGDGRTAASFDGATSFINVYSAGLNALFSGTAGSLLSWFQVTAAGSWTDGVQRRCNSFATGDSNIINLNRGSNNAMVLGYRAGAVSRNQTQIVADLLWHGLLMTWNAAGDIVNYYYDGTKLSPLSTLGVWAGNLSATRTVIGAYTTTPSLVWLGNLAHVAVWNKVLTDAQGQLLTRP